MKHRLFPVSGPACQDGKDLIVTYATRNVNININVLRCIWILSCLLSSQRVFPSMATGIGWYLRQRIRRNRKVWVKYQQLHSGSQPKSPVTLHDHHIPSTESLLSLHRFMITRPLSNFHHNLVLKLLVRDNVRAVLSPELM